LNVDNLLLKGSNLRNTDFVYGIVVYTGHHTKVMMNSAKPRRKLSDLESLMNKSILIILVAQFILALIAAITGTVLYKTRYDNMRYFLDATPGKYPIS
jgi:phospholipid-transporting ATPase